MVNQQFAFAVHLMTLLACTKGKVDSAFIASSINTNPVVVRRLLRQLQEAGLIVSAPGKGGGSQLKKKAARISLREIYDAVQPRPMIHPNERKVWKCCPVSREMKRIMSSIVETTEQAVRSRLRRIALSDLVRQVR